MARLQRKKTTGVKKKKKQDSADGDAAVAKAPSAPKPSGVLGGKGKSGPRGKVVQHRRKKEPGKIRRFFDQSIQFLREVKIELKKVAWPTRKQTIGSTAVVLVLVLIIAGFLGLVDFLLANMFELFFSGN